MADFDAPSFSLGLDCDLFDSEPQITPVTHETHPSSSSNPFSVASATFKDEDDEFETLIVDDSEPEFPDSRPKLKRLRRCLTTSSTSSSVPAKAKSELHSTAVIDDEDTDQHLHTQHHVVCTSLNLPPSRPGALTVKKKQHLSNDRETVSTDSDADSCDPVVGRKCNGSDLNSNLGKYDDLHQHVKRMQNVSNAWGDFPKAYRYFFHDDSRIQELVRSRLPNFSPLGNLLNIDLEQPGTSKIDYMGQFRFGESSKQAARTVKNKRSSPSRKISRKSETEMSQGWVNPKLGVGKVTTKGAVKRKAHTARQTAGHWLTGSDGKKVYVGKRGQELMGRVAYMQYKKESGLGFKKVKRKSVNKKKK
ncbi:hypothetical protein L1987_85200 [Smallanthus sonchifolius]|uniref:Uncharacterized protein n=1 Tax=Smallanthus sonchifolius TaxID=185202 RepID=A0ACB8XX23_9ASTR|nr:hypothetical protein L1987_85200 [Smallanthus sonchifolius]